MDHRVSTLCGSTIVGYKLLWHFDMSVQDHKGWFSLWPVYLSCITCGINLLIAQVSLSLCLGHVLWLLIQCRLSSEEMDTKERTLHTGGGTDCTWGGMVADWHKGLLGAVESEDVLEYFPSLRTFCVISGHAQLQLSYLFVRSREMGQCTLGRETDRGVQWPQVHLLSTDNRLKFK